MALTYRNTLKGHVVEVPEPADIIAAAQVESERLFRKGNNYDRLEAELVMEKARSRAVQMRQTLAKMEESRRWERYTASPVTPVQELRPAPEPAPEQAVKAAKAAPKKETEA